MTVPAGGEVITIVAGAELMVMLTGPIAVSIGLLESLTLTVTIDVPATVGVPLTTQLEFIARPAGSVPETIVQV